MKLHLLTFRTSARRTIIVQVYEHSEHPIFTLKFFDKSHRFSDKKYRLLSAIGEAAAVVNTCIAIMLYFYERNRFASFAFMGAPTEAEQTENIQLKRHPAYNTKRFRLYRRIMSLFFNPARFLHIQNPFCSVYFLVNRDYLSPKTEVNLNSMIEMLKIYYEDEILVEGFRK